jgi:hypothetical protein
MTLNRQDGLDAVHVGVANRGREIARAFLPGRPRVGAERWQEGPSSGPPELSGLNSCLLAWTAALSVIGGLIGLAVSPAFEVAVPRWFILAYGVGCALQALLALLLSRPWQQRPTSTCQDHGLLMGEGPMAFWAAAAKASMAHFSCIDPKRAAVRPADRASIVAP